MLQHAPTRCNTLTIIEEGSQSNMLQHTAPATHGSTLQPLQHTATNLLSSKHDLTATWCNTLQLQHTAGCCSMLQHAVTRCNTLKYATTHLPSSKQNLTATCCNMLHLQRTVARCNMLQYITTHYNIPAVIEAGSHSKVPQHAANATHCNALQHAATCCHTPAIIEAGSHSNKLQHTAPAKHCNTLQHAATRCNTPAIIEAADEITIQNHRHTCVAVSCSELQ